MCLSMLHSYSGVGVFLKSKNPDVKVVLADPQVASIHICIHVKDHNVMQALINSQTG